VPRPTHWTYKEFSPNDGLFQGDIITRKAPLLDILREVHKHFTDPKYLAFIVLTQTCDLVVRGKSCKAKHLSLAVVRPLSALMPEVLADLCQSPCPGVYSKDRRIEAEEFLHRVLNQNEQANGWVYLHPDADAGIAEPAVAMLRVSISLRAAEHYQTLQQARCGRLDTEYRNKLGWLKGNLYARIDTTDWGEQKASTETEKAIIKDLLDAQVAARPPFWVPAAWIEAVRRKQIKLGEMSAEQAEQVLRENAPKPPLEVALAEVKRVVNQMCVEFTDQPVAAFQSAIDSDPALIPLLAREAVEVVRSAGGLTSNPQLWTFYTAILDDRLFREQVAQNINQAAAAFIRRQGERKVRVFVTALADFAPISGTALDRVMLLFHKTFGGESPTTHKSVRGALLDLKCPPPLIAHLQATAVSAIQSSLADLAIGRLNNSNLFKRAVKTE
jgi:hypothetical protein